MKNQKTHSDSRHFIYEARYNNHKKYMTARKIIERLAIAVISLILFSVIFSIVAFG